MPTKRHSRDYIVFSAVALCLGLLVLLAYRPGLQGPFLFDDFASLSTLGATGEIDTLAELRRYLASGTAGPTGRPFALLSFLIDDYSWPSNPYSFKRTNLLLHLLNGVFLFSIVRLLLHSQSPTHTTRPVLIPGFVTCFWLFHPLLVSTVLYPVQRMTILATLFVLVGILIYLVGRRCVRTKPAVAAILMTLAIAIFTPLAALSKENGAMLPLLLFVIECTFIRGSPSLLWWQQLHRHILLTLPSAAILGYLISYAVRVWPNNGAYADRAFSLPERLLTQIHVLGSYLQNWFLPGTNYRGLLGEFPIASTLENPGTLFGLSLLIAITAAALHFRRTLPLSAGAWLFFLTGHVVESTAIPLELYFEHRNYLPTLFLGFPIAGIVLCALNNRLLQQIILMTILAILLGLTWDRASLWGDPTNLHVYWAERHPYSQRAQRAAALELERTGQLNEAYQLLQGGITRMPDNAALHLHQLALLCKYAPERTVNKVFAQTVTGVRNGTYEPGTFTLLRQLVQSITGGRCDGLGPTDAGILLDAVAAGQTPEQSRFTKFQIAHTRAVVTLKAGNIGVAADLFRDAFELRPHPETGLQQAAQLATAGALDHALDHLALVKSHVRRGQTLNNVIGPKIWLRDIQHLENQIRVNGETQQ
ncbi:hypothetical protein [Arhodomonas sp. SL1]|uniref:hypothetical protein n=1 Tax=Arhodomonas sp. SL1 TaxID=3425691 RepID=UPI003F8849FF